MRAPVAVAEESEEELGEALEEAVCEEHVADCDHLMWVVGCGLQGSAQSVCNT